MDWEFHSFLGPELCRRYSDGGAAATGETGASATGAPAADAGAAPGTDPAPPKAQEQTPPKKEAEASKADEPAKTYTEADLEAARKAGAEEARRHFKETTDYEKMTPEEKVAHLEKQMAEEKLTRYTADALVKAGADASLAAFVKGADEKDTDERVKAFKAVFDKSVQTGVEARFKQDGHTPRLGVSGTLAAETEKKPRGVTVK